MALSTKLVTRADYATYKQMSVTLSDDVLDAQTLDAQIQDVAPLLGEELFNAVQKNPAGYNALLNGGEYTVAGKTYTNYGLKAVIVYYGYARYRMFGQITETPFGFVEKLEGAESRPEDSQSKKSQYTLNRDSAFTIWKSVENFLIRTKEPLFGNSGCIVKRSNSGGMSFNKISKYK